MYIYCDIVHCTTADSSRVSAYENINRPSAFENSDKWSAFENTIIRDSFENYDINISKGTSF